MFNFRGIAISLLSAVPLVVAGCGETDSDSGGTGGSKGGTGGATGGSAGASGGAGGATGGSAGSSGGSAGSTGGSAGAPNCTSIEKEMGDFIAANKDCSSPSDCVTATAQCWQAQEDCCVVYLKSTHDKAKWASLNSTLSKCVSGCGCCAAIPADPDCIASKSGPKL